MLILPQQGCSVIKIPSAVTVEDVMYMMKDLQSINFNSFIEKDDGEAWKYFIFNLNLLIGVLKHDIKNLVLK